MDENQEIDTQELEQQQELVRYEQDLRLEIAAENQNLASDLPADVLSSIARQVVENTKADLSSRDDWEEKRAHWVRLFYQTDYENVGQSTWASCESIPLLTEACNMFATRTQKAFFSKPEFIGAKVVQMAKGENLAMLRERADRVAAHLNWQLTYKNKTYRSDKSALFLATSIHGSYFTKTYFDPIKRRNVVENVSPDDLIVPYTVGPVDIEELPRKTHVCRVNMQDCRGLVSSGYLTDMPEVSTDMKLTPAQLSYNEAVGLSQPASHSGDDDNGVAVLLEQYLYLDLDGEWKPYIVTVDSSSQKVLRISINWEATPTGNPTNDDEPYKPIEYFTHYKFLDNPDGFYGYGYGQLLGDLNSSVNIMLRSTMDAATLANDGNSSGMISSDVADDSEEFRMEIGNFKKLGTTVADIRQKIYTFQVPGPSDALIKLMQFMDARGQRLGSITEATTGSSEKVQQPTTIITQVEQAMELMTSVQLGIARSMTDELNKLFRLNRLYMPAQEYFVVNEEPRDVAISDYKGDMLIEPVFDPRFSSQAQKLALAQAELQAVLNNPMSQTRPQVIDLAFKNYLEAVGSDKIDEYFPEAPQPENIDDQEIENAYFLLPANERPPFDVFPEQNHDLHLAQLDEFMKNYADTLDEQTLLQIQDHKRKHLAFQYMRDKAGMAGPIPPAAVRYPSELNLNGINMAMFGNGVSGGEAK